MYEYHYSIVKFMNLTVAVINIKQMYHMHVEAIHEFMYKQAGSIIKNHVCKKKTVKRY